MKEAVGMCLREFPCGRLRRSSADVARAGWTKVMPGPFVRTSLHVIARPANKTGVASHFERVGIGACTSSAGARSANKTDAASAEGECLRMSACAYVIRPHCHSAQACILLSFEASESHRGKPAEQVTIQVHIDTV